MAPSMCFMLLLGNKSMILSTILQMIMDFCMSAL